MRQQARNIAAFEVIKDVLVDGNPILSKMLSGVRHYAAYNLHSLVSACLI